MGPAPHVTFLIPISDPERSHSERRVSCLGGSERAGVQIQLLHLWRDEPNCTPGLSWFPFLIWKRGSFSLLRVMLASRADDVTKQH